MKVANTLFMTMAFVCVMLDFSYNIVSMCVVCHVGFWLRRNEQDVCVMWDFG